MQTTQLMQTTQRNHLLNAMLFTALCLSLTACDRRGAQPATDTDATTASPMSNNGGNSASPASSPTLSASPTSSASPVQASADNVTGLKSGWWIRINPTLTTAQTITFQIGTSKRDREEWRVWQATEAKEFSVPAKFAQAPRLYLRGNVSPIGKMADLCLMYKDRGVEHMDFTDDESETKSQFQTDLKCSQPR